MNARRDALLTFATLLLGAQSSNAMPLTVTKGQPMDEQQFWPLVEDAKTASGLDIDCRPIALEKLLSTLPLESIQAFQQRYEHLLIEAHSWKLWGAAYVMNGGCSDDGFKYFRDWLISEGRTIFESAIKDPALSHRCHVAITLSLNPSAMQRLMLSRKKGEVNLTEISTLSWPYQRVKSGKSQNSRICSLSFQPSTSTKADAHKLRLRVPLHATRSGAAYLWR